MSDHPEMGVRTTGLNLWYGDFQALQDINFEAARGIITGLIGPSGCGKSTLLRCFNRMNERYGNVTTTGEILIHGQNIYDQEVSLVELRKAVGMVFQRPNPLPMSVKDNVLFGLDLHLEPEQLKKTDLEQVVEQALREVFLWEDLKDHLEANATSLQLEQQQKLCIARLLPLKPRVILMDEPCSSLDTDATRAVEELMLELSGEYTILIVTHNMSQARRISEECVFMLMGEIIEAGPTQKLFLNPDDKRTEEYVEGRYG
jgi:phosphate transport system ATP-binding protein